MMSKRLACMAVVASLAGAPVWAAETPEDLAQKAAESWLRLVDEGKYEESWDQAAKLFKGAVTREQWKQAAAGVRGPLGKLVSPRQAREYTEKVPGGGRERVNTPNERFENKIVGDRTVTPMLDPDGTWRVSGYSSNEGGGGMPLVWPSSSREIACCVR